MSSRLGPVWRTLVVAVVATVVYDYSWKLGVPLAVRNGAGLVLFSCIMFSPLWVYVLCRLQPMALGAAVRFSLLLPIVWHVKEMLNASKIYGLGPGLYTGIQGPYLAYYALCFLAMGVGHLFLSILPARRGQVSLKHTPLFVLPAILLGSIEGLGFALFNYDLLVFQGFLTGYRALFSG